MVTRTQACEGHTCGDDQFAGGECECVRTNHARSSTHAKCALCSQPALKRARDATFLLDGRILELEGGLDASHRVARAKRPLARLARGRNGVGVRENFELAQSQQVATSQPLQ